MMTMQGVSVGMMSSYNDWLNWYAATAAAVNVWSLCPLLTFPCMHVCLVAY